jgi:hypothetical protein
VLLGYLIPGRQSSQLTLLLRADTTKHGCLSVDCGTKRITAIQLAALGVGLDGASSTLTGTAGAWRITLTGSSAAVAVATAKVQVGAVHGVRAAPSAGGLVTGQFYYARVFASNPPASLRLEWNTRPLFASLSMHPDKGSAVMPTPKTSSPPRAN